MTRVSPFKLTRGRRTREDQEDDSDDVMEKAEGLTSKEEPEEADEDHGLSKHGEEEVLLVLLSVDI